MTIDIDVVANQLFSKICEVCTREGIDKEFKRTDLRALCPDVSAGHVDLATDNLVKKNFLKCSVMQGVYRIEKLSYQKHVMES